MNKEIEKMFGPEVARKLQSGGSVTFISPIGEEFEMRENRCRAKTRNSNTCIMIGDEHFDDHTKDRTLLPVLYHILFNRQFPTTINTFYDGMNPNEQNAPIGHRLLFTFSRRLAFGILKNKEIQKANMLFGDEILKSKYIKRLFAIYGLDWEKIMEAQNDWKSDMPVLQSD